MHAVIVNVTINDADAAERDLQEQLLPRVSQIPGFVAGYWTVKDDSGLTMIVFESEAAANGMRELVSSTVPDAMTLQDAEVRQVVAHA
jgi:hypothetical protein